MLGKPLTASRTARLAAAPAARRPARRARRAPLPLAAWLREMFGGQGGDGDKVKGWQRRAGRVQLCESAAGSCSFSLVRLLLTGCLRHWPPQVVHFIRHGQTEMNVYLRDCPPGYGYGEPGFRDPQIHDTRLTPTGLAQAAAAAAQVARLQPEPEVRLADGLGWAALGVLGRACCRWNGRAGRDALAAAKAPDTLNPPPDLLPCCACPLRPCPRPRQVVVVSPLTRALQTADTIFAGLSVPRLVHPLVAERLYLSSDVGHPRTQLEQEFPHYEFGELPHGPGLAAAWWHTSGSSGSSSGGGSSDGGEYSEGSGLSEEEALLAVEYEPDGEREGIGSAAWLVGGNAMVPSAGCSLLQET